MNWLSRFLRNRILSDDEVIDLYAGVLTASKYEAGGTHSVADLPCSKTRIKEALLASALRPGVSSQKFHLLHSSFVALADFQPGGGGTSVFSEADAMPRDNESIRRHAIENAEAMDRELELAKGSLSESERLMKEWQIATARGRRNA